MADNNLSRFEDFLNQEVDWTGIDDSAGVPLDGDEHIAPAHTSTEYELSQELLDQIVIRSSDVAQFLLDSRDPATLWEENLDAIYIKMRVGVGNVLMRYFKHTNLGPKLSEAQWAQIIAVVLSVGWITDAMLFRNNNDDDDLDFVEIP